MIAHVSDKCLQFYSERCMCCFFMRPKIILLILSVMSANHIRNKHEDRAPCLLPTCVVSFIVTMECLPLTYYVRIAEAKGGAKKCPILSYIINDQPQSSKCNMSLSRRTSPRYTRTRPGMTVCPVHVTTQLTLIIEMYPCNGDCISLCLRCSTSPSHWITAAIFDTFRTKRKHQGW